MLLLLFSGAGAGSPPKKVAGWMPEWGFRHDPVELERRLVSQKSDRKWFDDFITAAKMARRAADKSKSDKQKRALIYAAEAVADAVALVIGQESGPPYTVITAIEMLRSAAGATRATAAIKRAESVIAMVSDWEDEDEIMLLLH